ncbi:unnamed protein product [marine sediment metagenome]|uniref:Uncharacterized protein n=1 Tax=marine sediment metagenome TaxID=412755 RepID=X1S2K8_9ZZZZ
MEFWKWYFKGVLNIPRYIIDPWGEYMLAIVLGLLASAMLSILVSYYWLILTVPVFCTMAAHGLWRATIKSRD